MATRLCQGIKFGTNAAGECAISTTNLPSGYTAVDVLKIEVEPIDRNCMLAAKVTLPVSHMHLAGVHVQGTVVDVTPVTGENRWRSYARHVTGEEKISTADEIRVALSEKVGQTPKS